MYIIYYVGQMGPAPDLRVWGGAFKKEIIMSFKTTSVTINVAAIVGVIICGCMIFLGDQTCKYIGLAGLIYLSK